MKTQITVEIPDGYEITSLFRGKQYGQYDDGSAAIPYTIHIRPVKPLIINGVPSDWPDWLTCDWVAKDKNGKVYAYNGRRPTEESKGWHSYDGWWDITDILPIRIPGAFEQSLRKNPLRKK